MSLSQLAKNSSLDKLRVCEIEDNAPASFDEMEMLSKALDCHLLNLVSATNRAAAAKSAKPERG